MPETGGPPKLGVAPIRGRYHYFSVDSTSDGQPIRLRAPCGIQHPGAPETLRGFEPLANPDAPFTAPEGSQICARCVENFGKRRRTEARVTKTNREELVNDGKAKLLAGLTGARMVRGDPAIWDIRFHGQTYSVKSTDIFDHERFRVWYIQTFHRPLMLDASAWHEILDAVGVLVDEVQDEERDDEEDASERTMLKEVVLAALAELSVVEEPALVGDTNDARAFQHKDKTWVLTKDVMRSVQREGFKMKPVEVSKAMRDLGIFLSKSQDVRIGKTVMRAWPVDPKNLANAGEVLGRKENGERVDKKQTMLAEKGVDGNN
jgi:hypothetical protein